MGFRYVVQAGLDLTVFPPHSPKCLDCVYESPYPNVCGEGVCGCSEANNGCLLQSKPGFTGLTLNVEFTNSARLAS